MMPRNILVRMPNWVGDLVMATPVLSDLREAFPSASITAMCRTPVCELLRTDAAINELFCFTKPSNNFLRRQDLRNIIAKIQQGKFDVAVLLTHSFSSAWWGWQGRIGRRIGYAGHFRRWLLTDPVPWPKETIHQVDVYKKLLEPLGIPRSKTVPRLFVLDQEIEASRKLLRQRGYASGAKLVGIHPGAAYGSAKCWLPERFRELALALSKDAYVAVFGDSSSLALARKICGGMPERVMNFAGATSLRELACMIKECDLLITNDSGPMHMAAAFGTPLVALFGSTDDRATGPYGQLAAIVNKRVACSPCFKRVCPIDFSCMKEIGVEEVLEKAKNLLETKRRV